MDDSFRNAMNGGLAHIFSQIQGMVEAQAPPEPAMISNAMLCATLPVEGERPGRLYLCTTEGLCAKLVSLLFEGVPVSREALGDAACELLNMVGESTRTLLSQGNLRISVGVPQLVSPVPNIHPGGEHIVRTESMDEPVHLWFEARPRDVSTPEKEG
ncbi:MAG: chemotaxis protein CheX [Pseudomonadota bacterium]